MNLLANCSKNFDFLVVVVREVLLSNNYRLDIDIFRWRMYEGNVLQVFHKGFRF